MPEESKDEDETKMPEEAEAKDECKEEEEVDKPPPEAYVVVAGLADDAKYTRAVEVARELCEALPEYATDEIVLLEPAWEAYLRSKAVSVAGKCTVHTASPLVLLRTPDMVEHYVGSVGKLEALFEAELGRPPRPADRHALEAESHARHLEILNASRGGVRGARRAGSTRAGEGPARRGGP